MSSNESSSMVECELLKSWKNSSAFTAYASTRPEIATT
eukprot:CAMPEP_0171972598 /NCGR_PEP_ID=MMETSP0993-20121228/223704_1 /TAXON_ID=483369 /ORGANISM="non described non described, Strain CCMP2098" /LENGTH=37 /DNA_ID= /DNA_START= /DNA_END= /DNA_ORIENTATION=